MLRQILGKHKKILLGYFKNRKKYSSCSSDTVFICGAPEHGNLGDQAILLSEYMMVSGLLPGRNIVVIPELELYDNLLCLKRFTKRNHNLCVFHGGGNIGELYSFQEGVRLTLVKHLRKANIVVFPQTIDYQQDSEYLSYARKIYESHPSFFLFVREENSEKKRTAFFPKCQGALVPDIVMSYQPELIPEKRNGVLFCIRSDKEKVQKNDSVLRELEQCVKSVFTSVRRTDTYSPEYRKPYDQQSEQLHEFWQSYSSAELVITDRLHGMIFALITGTPCIALDNSTGKVGSLYRTWLRNSSVIFVDDAESLNRAKAYITSGAYKEEITDIRKEIDQKFKPLKDYILKFR